MERHGEGEREDKRNYIVPNQFSLNTICVNLVIVIIITNVPGTQHI